MLKALLIFFLRLGNIHILCFNVSFYIISHIYGLFLFPQLHKIVNIQKFVVFHSIQKGQQYGIITFYITWQKAKIAFIYSHYEQKKIKLCHCKIWHDFFFGVHNVNNAIFTYCHVIRNVIMTEKTTIKNKTV